MAAKKKSATRKKAASTRKKKVTRKKTRATRRKASPARKKAAGKKTAKKKAAVKKKAAAKKKPGRKKAAVRKKAAAKKKPTAKKKTTAKKKAAGKKRVSKATGKKKSARKKPAPKKAAASKAAGKKAARKTGVGRAKVVRRKSTRRRGGLLSGPSTDFKPYSRRRGESYMNDAQLGHFRDKLISWKRELMEEVDRTVHHMKDEAANFPDPNDRATQESEFSLELRTRDRERKLLRKIDSALQRIKDGSYGYCEETGEEIGLQRLEARPVATLCLEAQERRELAEKQYRDDR